MKEDFLHYLWKFKKFDFLHLKSTANQSIQLIAVGQHNQNQAGPDFFNSQIKIDGQLWAGNVEIHLKSSDWYAHHHETDSAYDNVILHVVWHEDVEVYRANNSVIPTLELKNYVSHKTLTNYHELLDLKPLKWINCERDFPDFSDFELTNWLERLYVERLQVKSKTITDLLQQNHNDWEATLFCLLAKNFGLNVNGSAFFNLAKHIPYAVIRKIQEVMPMEALFFGQVGLLDRPGEANYYRELQQEYAYLKQKFQLKRQLSEPVHFFRLRPQNFPTIRLAQLANLIVSKRQLFSQLIAENNLRKIRENLQITTSEFWKTHYTFEKNVKPCLKKLSPNFINLLIINTVVPLKFAYTSTSVKKIDEELFALMRQLPLEKNRITKGFNRLRSNTAKDALSSQALLQLKHNYCDKNRCLHCNLGIKLLQKG